VDQSSESGWFSECSSAAWELQLPFAKGPFEQTDKLAAEDQRKGFDREEESLTGGYPTLEIEGQRPSRNEAVQMEVIAECLVPGVQDTDEPELAIEVSAPKLKQGLRDSFEQDIAEHVLVDQYEWIEFAGG